MSDPREHNYGEGKVANHDWVDYQACSLLQYITDTANLFIIGNYFNKLR